MTRQEILDKLIPIVWESISSVEVTTEEITEDTSLADDLAFDSLDFIEMTLRMEEEFNITDRDAIWNDTIDAIWNDSNVTVKDLVDLIEQSNETRNH